MCIQAQPWTRYAKTQTHDAVDDLMSDVYNVPAFTNARPAHAGHTNPGQVGKPRLKQHPRSNSGQHGSQPNGHPDQPLAQLFKWVSHVDRYGDEYRTLVEATPPPKQPPAPPKQKVIVQAQPGWSYDEHSGRMYRVGHQPRSEHGRSGRIVADSQGNGQQVGQDHNDDRRRSVSTPVRQGKVAHLSPARVQSRRGVSTENRFHNDNTHGQAGDREGKTLSIVNHARTLPVEFAKSVTSKNMSFAVFMYGAVSEIHSSMSGLEPPMDQETLEAKLQHIMNVIHVTCLNATASDFKPVAWLVGRTYHNLVQSKVDLGRECWADFNTLYRGSPHAAEMVAAEREHRAAFMKQPKQEKPERGADRNSDKIKKPLCSSWNNFETEGKCKWESENPGQTCNRSHHCSYCEKKGNPKTFHQERFCKKKLAEDK